MAGIMAAMKSFDELGSQFSNNPALKAIQQARQRRQSRQQAVNQVAGVAGVAGATPTSAAPAAPVADTSDLESRIAALEKAGSNIADSTVQASTPPSSIVQAATPPPSTPSSMSAGAIATGEAIFGTQPQRDMAVDPNIFNRRFN